VDVEIDADMVEEKPEEEEEEEAEEEEDEENSSDKIQQPSPGRWGKRDHQKLSQSCSISLFSLIAHPKPWF